MDAREMGLSPGKYGEECALVAEMTRGTAVILLVIGGFKGHGFSVRAPKEVAERVPQLLRTMADDIEKKNKAAANQ